MSAEDWELAEIERRLHGLVDDMITQLNGRINDRKDEVYGGGVKLPGAFYFLAVR
jgi:hypothetical protein